MVLTSTEEWAGLGEAAGDDFELAHEEPTAFPNPACSAAKNRLSLSIGNCIRSCRHSPGKASSCVRDHFTPTGIKRWAGASTASASAWLPMRHKRLSVLSRAPPQAGQGV